MKSLRIFIFSLITMSLLPVAAMAQTLDYIVAVADEDVILRSELNNYLNGVVNQLRQRNTPLPARDVLEKQGIERLVVRSLQLQRAEKTGIKVDDNTLNSSLQGIARKNGMNLEQFRNALSSQGVDYTSFREDIRNEIIITRLRQRDVINRISVNDREIEDYLERQKSVVNKNQLVSFSHILISLPDDATSSQVQAAEAKAQQALTQLQQGANFSQMAIAYSDGQKAMEGGEYDFRPMAQTPPLFAKKLREMQPGDITDIFRSPYGFHILKLNGFRGEEKHIVQQTRLRHILIRVSELVSSQEAETRMQQLYGRLQDGEDFAVLARAHSDDTLSAKEGGSLGWIGAGDTVPEFEQVFTELQTGQFSKPFKSRYGWHIVQVMERRQHDDTEKFKRTKAIADIKQQKTEEELQSWLRRLRDEAYVDIRLGQYQP